MTSIELNSGTSVNIKKILDISLHWYIMNKKILGDEIDENINY